MKLKSIFTRTGRLTLSFGILALLFAPVGRASAPAGRYTVASGTVTDTQTGLVWQQADDGKTYTFAEAQSHCAALGGTWRVPTLKELLTLMDEGHGTGPWIDATAFPNAPAVVFWTSVPSAKISGNAWFVDFSSGESYDYYGATDTFAVRCVR